MGAGEDTFNDLVARAKAASKHYKELQKASIAESITMIGDDLDVVTEFLVPKLNAKDLAHWKTRATKIEKINDALADFETGIIEETALANDTIWATEIHKAVAKIEWMAGHIGEITLALAAALGYASGRFGGDIWKGIKSSFKALFSGDVDKLTDELANLAVSEMEMIEELAKSAVLGLMAEILEGTVAALEAKNYALMLKPVLELKTITEDRLKAGAFPQGKGRVRRMKRHRLK
jgi:hypothetical protein